MRIAVLTLITSCALYGQTYSIMTFAGGALPVNIKGPSASLYGPNAVTADKAGNVYFTDHNVVLRLDAASGNLSLFAGAGKPGFIGDDGPAVLGRLNNPQGIFMDTNGYFYIADSANNRIRKVVNGIISTVAGGGSSLGDGGPATGAQLNAPQGVAVDKAGNIYIADTGNHRIRKITGGVISTVAGTGTPGFGGDSGPGAAAQLNFPGAVAVDDTGNVYIADTGNSRVRKISVGTITTMAGTGTAGFAGDSGPAAAAQLNNPTGVAWDATGNLYIADGSNRIRKVTGGVITTIAGTGTAGFSGDGGPASGAMLTSPISVTADPTGNLYIADTGNHRIRQISAGVITTLAGNGSRSAGDGGLPISAQLLSPVALALSASGNLYIADYADNTVRAVINGGMSTVAGSGTPGFGGDSGSATSALLSGPAGLAVDNFGLLYISDQNNNRVRRVANGTITTVAGTGTAGFGGDSGGALSAQLSGPSGLATDSAGNLYIADTGNNRVRMVAGGVITTVAGNGTSGFSGDGGPATGAQLSFPTGVALDSAGNLYIADQGNNRIRKVVNGVITTVAGNGVHGFNGDNGPATSAALGHPGSVVVDSAGNLFVSDPDNGRIRRVSGGIITTIAGGGFGLGELVPATTTQLIAAGEIALDPSGKLYLADSFNSRVRVLTPGTLPVINLNGVVPAYSSAPAIQPGSWVSLFGMNLASGTFVWGGDFPASLGGTTVSINNKPAYLWLVSPSQINLQAPDDTTTGPVSVVVNTPWGTTTSMVTLGPYGPSLSLLGDGRHIAAEIVTPGGTGAFGGGTYDLAGPLDTFSFTTRPVKAGETLVLFGTGFGPTNPAVPAGKAYSGAAPASATVNITIGGVKATVGFAGETQAGLFQFNVTVPPNTGTGDVPVLASVNGIPTPVGPVVTVQ